MRTMKPITAARTKCFTCFLVCVLSTPYVQAANDTPIATQIPAREDGLKSAVVFGELRIELPYSMLSQVVVLPLGFPNLAIGARQASEADLIHFGTLDKFGETLKLYKQKGVIGAAAAANFEKFFDTLSDAVQKKPVDGDSLKRLMEVEAATSAAKHDSPMFMIYRFDLVTTKTLYVIPKDNGEVYYIKGVMTETQVTALISGLANPH